MDDAGSGGGEQATKKRRILACERCRQVKVRCEFDQESGDCKRCQRLRIECSLSQETGGRASETGRPSSAQSGNLGSLSSRLDRHESLLESLRTEVKSLTSQIKRGNTAGGRRSDDSSTPNYVTEKDWYDHPGQAADAATGLAPVSILRRQGPMNSGMRRLLDATDDIVIQGLLSEEQAIHMEQIFLHRIGPWIQVENWGGFGGHFSSIRDESSLLFAVCCLQGGRLDAEFNNSAQHIALYEYVRKAMQRLFLISPLPADMCLSFLIMAMWSNGPRDVSEYIDSWLLSGYTAQQEMLNLSFTKLIANMQSNNASALDRLGLRLWNSTCLCHLQFALGTGRPSVITRTYIEQARSIINSFEASTYDGYELAAISLFLQSEELLTADVFSGLHRVQKAVNRWKSQWNHLLESQDHRLCCFKLTYDFCQLVIARRALEEHRVSREIHANGKPAKSHPSLSNGKDEETLKIWFDMSSSNALNMVRTFGGLPLEVLEGLPDFFYLAVTYGMMALAQLVMKPHHHPATAAMEPDDLVGVLQHALAHGQRASAGRIRSMDYTITKLGEMLDAQDGVEGLGGSGMKHSSTREFYENWATPDLGVIFSEMIPDFFSGADVGL